MVNGAPADPGVYALWENEELIYYGRAQGEGTTIQSRLLECLNGADACTVRATHYGWEISGNPRVREAELLREYARENGGKPPRCNARSR